MFSAERDMEHGEFFSHNKEQNGKNAQLLHQIQQKVYMYSDMRL